MNIDDTNGPKMPRVDVDWGSDKPFDRDRYLLDLKHKVEAGDLSCPDDERDWNYIQLAYNGSIDAAMAIHRATLSDWQVWMQDGIGVSMKPKSARYWQELKPYTENPARAYLLAIVESWITGGDRLQ